MKYVSGEVQKIKKKYVKYCANVLGTREETREAKMPSKITKSNVSTFKKKNNKNIVKSSKQ